MKEHPECGMEYNHPPVLLGVHLRGANASRLIWNKHMKTQRNHVLSLDSLLREMLQGSLSSGSSGSGVRERAKTSGGGVLKRLDDATGIAGIEVRL